MTEPPKPVRQATAESDRSSSIQLPVLGVCAAGTRWRIRSPQRMAAIAAVAINPEVRMEASGKSCSAVPTK
jgi:hypothetical protein